MILGIEIGGTKLQLVIGDKSGSILDRRRLNVNPALGAPGIRGQIQLALPELVGGNKLSAVGVGFGGSKLDRETFNKAAEGLDSQPREAAMLVLLSAKLSKLMPDDTIKSRMRPLLDRPWVLDRFSGEFYARYREPAISLLAANAVFRGEEIADRMASRQIGVSMPYFAG